VSVQSMPCRSVEEERKQKGERKKKGKGKEPRTSSENPRDERVTWMLRIYSPPQNSPTRTQRSVNDTSGFRVGSHRERVYAYLVAIARQRAGDETFGPLASKLSLCLSLSLSPQLGAAELTTTAQCTELEY